MASTDRVRPAALLVPASKDTAEAETAEAAAAPTSATTMAARPDRPPIAALFLIEFDVKAGYTIAWKEAAPGLELGGDVEFKSLPSGLHTVAEDLVYFVHEGDEAATSNADAEAAPADGYAGLSAFVNRPTDDAAARHARMVAVGVLVPRSYGRLGRAWRHAEALTAMARSIAADPAEKTPLLEAYWRDNRAGNAAVGVDASIYNNRCSSSSSTTTATSAYPPPRPLLLSDSPLSSPIAVTKRPPLPLPGCPGQPLHARHRSASDGTALLLPPGHRLSPHHPAWSLTSLLHTFGPLIFPIYRAALLRKRILISTHAPVREANNFVYNLSVLANIPISVLDIVDVSALSQQRIRPLFTVGVNDIGFLAADAATKTSRGWIACTTDSILAVKADLWDLLITMPGAATSSAAGSMAMATATATATATTTATATKVKVWPKVEYAKGVPVKATQRDLRRFRSLMAGLQRWEDQKRRGGTGRGHGRGRHRESADELADAAESLAVVEPVTWAALAYNGFMWWASAGEQRRSDEMEESIYDASLLADIVPAPAPATAAAAAASVGAAAVAATAAATAASPPGDRQGITGETDTGTNAADTGSNTADDDDEEEERARIELAIITYFHRMTTQTFSVLADVVESSEELDEDSDGESVLGSDGEGAGGDYDEEAYDDDDDNDDDAASENDALLGARRSGLASTPAAASSSSSSTAALLLRRRGGQTTAKRGGRSQQQRKKHSGHTHTSSGSLSSSSSSHNPLRISGDAVMRMGLDVWSPADAEFVAAVAAQYFGWRNAQVEGLGIEVCGLKVC